MARAAGWLIRLNLTKPQSKLLSWLKNSFASPLLNQTAPNMIRSAANPPPSARAETSSRSVRAGAPSIAVTTPAPGGQITPMVHPYRPADPYVPLTAPDRRGYRLMLVNRG